MTGFHKVLAFITEDICLTERISSIGILHDAICVLAMFEPLGMTKLVQHNTEQLTISMRAVGREYGYAAPDAIGHSHNAAVWPVAEIVQSDVCLCQTYDNG